MIKAEYVNHLGDSLTVVNAARVSLGSASDSFENRDKKLVKYLADNEHFTPFEHCVLSVKISCPLYIRSQIHRHRTFSYNEISRRYTSKDLEFYTPSIFRKQSKINKQVSNNELPQSKALKVMVEDVHKRCLDEYNHLLHEGVCREQARGVLPQSLMTEFYMTGNLRNWAHFVRLRNHEHAQLEVQWIARDVHTLLMNHFGYAAEVLLDKK